MVLDLRVVPVRLDPPVECCGDVVVALRAVGFGVACEVVMGVGVECLLARASICVVLAHARGLVDCGPQSELQGEVVLLVCEPGAGAGHRVYPCSIGWSVGVAENGPVERGRALHQLLVKSLVNESCQGGL